MYSFRISAFLVSSPLPLYFTLRKNVVTLCYSIWLLSIALLDSDLPRVLLFSTLPSITNLIPSIRTSILPVLTYAMENR